MNTTRVPVNPELISWAIKRSRRPRAELEAYFKKLPEWESGETQPTEKQLEDFAQKTFVPLGFLLLSNPPQESIPIPDFRTIGSDQIAQPSPNLLTMIYMAQMRQDWFSEYARAENLPAIEFVNSATTDTPPEIQASKIREMLRFDFIYRKNQKTPDEELRYLIQNVESFGILVMASGIVNSNTSRKLDVKEFRGFTLCDTFAPLIFINSADSKSAQMFTLVHELGHLALGTSSLSNPKLRINKSGNLDESWCNKVSAEVLVPMNDLIKQKFTTDIDENINQFSKTFKVSKFVILKRMLDANLINHKDFERKWNSENVSVNSVKSTKKSGGDFYPTTLRRVSRKFASAIITSTLEGKTLYRDALKMLGISNLKTFDRLAEAVEIEV